MDTKLTDLPERGQKMFESIDITPSPRVLRMLGEIDFKAWQCLCELADNSIDSFVNQDAPEAPSIKIVVPRRNEIGPNSLVTVEDNGSGMTKETLANSLKAGFSGNDPVEKMGLFGMGFNISTARLGGKTEIITSTKEADHFLKVVIDFQELEKNKHYDIPIERVPKSIEEAGWHGTKIQISKLRTDHVLPLINGKKKIKQKLGKIYGKVLRERNVTITYNGELCRPFEHLVWDESRRGKSSAFGAVPAVIKIDHRLEDRRYCTTCWIWLGNQEPVCPSCGKSEHIVSRERRVKGWVGVQRDFDTDNYGVDLIRNGRVIKEFDKSIFYWRNEDDEEELEYPIDGFERKGRIVGELEIDFVKVTHQKDAFDTASKDWKDALRVVRGVAPIRPNIAKAANYPPNDSPLARLFSAFRTAKAGIENLIPTKPGGGAMITDLTLREMRRKFYDGETDYQSDEKWWELLVPPANEDDDEDEILPISPLNPDDPTGGNPFAQPTVDPDPKRIAVSPDAQDVAEEGDRDALLSRQYSLPEYFPNVSIRVDAQYSNNGSHDQGFTVKPKGAVMEFFYWPNSKIYKETFLRPEDFLINELAYQLHINSGNELSTIPLSMIEKSLKKNYFPDLAPDYEEVSARVGEFIDSFTDVLKDNIKNIKEFDSGCLNDADISLIRARLASNEYLSDKKIDEAVKTGGFIAHASFSVKRKIVRQYPELVFDGRFFTTKLTPLDAQLSSILARDLDVLLNDIEWFTDNARPSTDSVWRGRAKRLVGTLEVLRGWGF